MGLRVGSQLGSQLGSRSRVLRVLLPIRAFLPPPPATASFPTTIDRLQATIRTAFQGSTVITIAHRLGTVTRATHKMASECSQDVNLPFQRVPRS